MQELKKDLILIVGGGPAGLGAALAFHNNNYNNIVVLEGLTEFKFSAEESYPVGVNVRGQTAMRDLFGKSNHIPDVLSMGLRVDQWKIIVGPGINVANFYSGLVVGTRRADVIYTLYDEIKRRGSSIQILFGHEAFDADLEKKIIRCKTKTGEIKEFKPDCVVIADGYKSKIRDVLVKSEKDLQVQQWPWKMKFRVLLSDVEPETDLNPYVHYIYNQIYIAKLLDNRWTAGIAISEDSPKFLTSKDMSEENAKELKKYLAKIAPPAANLFSDEEYKRFFSRRTFTGSVTKVSKLVIDNWAVLLGDAAHSAIPATGEGINSALEDCSVLNKKLQEGLLLKETLKNYEKERLVDVNALSDMAYSAATPALKTRLQMFLLGIFRVGPSKEDLLFGRNSSIIRRYSDVVKVWQEQTKWLGGPNIPSPK